MTSRSALVVALGVVLGFTFNWVRPDGVPLESYQPKVSCGDAERDATVRVLAAADAAALCTDRGVVVADARSAAAYQEGHVAGAIHLPCSARSREVDRLVAARGDDVILVYGDSTQEGLDVARSLRMRSEDPELQVLVVEGGFAAWRDAGLACASGACNDCKEIANHVSSHE